MPRAVPQAASVYWMICSFLKAAVVAAPKVAHNRDGVVIMMLKSPMLITFNWIHCNYNSVEYTFYWKCLS